ncbi:phosphotransferase family protein [Georgenia alba]|uniref:Phosphotransferase family protein n=1 Tax=Georgenia alba TaxID=2233858 RepID=A0ABW2QBB7_9MICO
MPASAVAASLRSVSGDELMAEVSGGPLWPADLQRRLLHPSGAAAAVLLEPGSTVLALGTGWPALVASLGAFGGHVTYGDWVYSRMRFETLVHGPADLAVQIEPSAALPWDDGVFDRVYVDAGEVDCVLDPAGRRRLLTEVGRVLAADGVAVVGTRNLLRHLRGDRSARPRAREVLRSVRAFRHPSDRELRRSGLTAAKALVPFPRRHRWRWMVPVDGLRAQLRQDRSAHPIARAAGRAGLAAAVVADQYVLARRGGGQDRDLPTIAERLAGTPELRSPAMLALSDARVAVRGTREFLKIPLTRDQHRALAREVENITAARDTPFAPYLAGPARMARYGGLPYAVHPAVPHGAHEAARADAALREILLGLPAGETASLRETAVWRRLTTEHGRTEAMDTGMGPLRRALLETAGDARLPVGPSHGDLHAGNVLLGDDERPVLVDWNRFEHRNPLLLDALYAALDARRQQGAPLATALDDFVSGRLGGALAAHALGLLGTLSVAEGAALLLLDRAVSYGRRRSRYRPWTIPPLHEAAEMLTPVVVPGGGGAGRAGAD